jgi:hypothetical protein
LILKIYRPPNTPLPLGDSEPKLLGLPGLDEPWFLTFESDVELRIAMTPYNLQKGGLKELGQEWS